MRVSSPNFATAVSIFGILFFSNSLVCPSPLVADECLLGDVNLDGVVDFRDIQGFCDLLYSGGCQCEANINNESVVDLLDVWPFRDVLLEQQDAEFQSNTIEGQGDFFWSVKGMGEGAVNEELFVNVDVGDSVTLYLYYTTNGTLNSDINEGIAINVATSDSGVIEFTNAGVFNFDIQIQDIKVLRRWFYPVNDFQEAREIRPDLVVGMSAVNICQGEGILADYSNNTSTPFVDNGYDSKADAFLFGKVDLVAIDSGIVSLFAGRNGLGIAHDGQLVEPLFSNSTILVGTGVLGDANLDGSVNLLDVDDFVNRLAKGVFQFEADCNQDGFVNLLDVAVFVEILSGG